ncbi:uncharacterized protein LOC119089373 [Pollicipes pollicipes]|uniref:uncharacterized protein LOC119089373 n=1 Tax=Pollicipes pollicipes TaxID=41117 RepID=UPI00188536D2|nr:uncharacterized protein LOC119089373 [Pollicipes pollicipes]
MDGIAMPVGAPKKEIGRHPIAPKILSLFTSLTDKDAEQRVKAALLLVQQVASSEEHKQDCDVLSQDASYCLRRLVRGLSSSRAGAREGFFTALVQLLRQVPAVGAGQLLSVAAAQLPDVREDRQRTEHRLGRLLAAGAAVRAGRLDEQLAELTCQLLSAWTYRAYMPPMVASFVAELVQKVPEERFQSEVWPELSVLLARGWHQCVPERLWLLLVCRRQFPAVCDTPFLKQHWGSKKLLSPKNHTAIAEMIKASAATLPAIHPLVTSLVAFAVERPAAELVELHQRVLEPLLEDRTAALLVMAMLQMVVPHLTTPELLASVLSPAMVGALVRLLPKRDQRTEQAARGLGSALVSLLLAPDSDAQLQLALVGRLVSPPGSINFDHMTGTKILAQMINGLKAEALEPFSEIAISAFNGTQDDRNQCLDPQYSMNGGRGHAVENDGSEQEDSDEDLEAEDSEGGEEEEEDEDDSDVEDGEEDGEAQDELDAMRAKVKAALGDDSDDAVSIDMDDVPEEHFAKMDEALAAAFRAMRKDKRMKRGGRQTDEEQALMHFRIRVLDLADVYVRTYSDLGECVYPTRLFSQLLVRLYRRTQALLLLTAAFKNGALMKQVPAEDVLAGVSAGDGVKTKYLSSALEALLSLRPADAMSRVDSGHETLADDDSPTPTYDSDGGDLNTTCPSSTSTT